MIILGLNCEHGDSSACIFRDGKLISAAEEERFTRTKNCSDFPINAIKFCLNSSEVTINEIDYVSINTKSIYNIYYKIIFIIINPSFFFSLVKRFYNLLIKDNYAKYNLNFFFKKKFKLIYTPHHLAHALSAINFNKPQKNNLVFSFDGSGDFSTIECYLINDNNIKLVDRTVFPNSLGFLYTAFTQFFGFSNYGDEYKVMGLSGYGKPIYEEKILKLIKSLVPFKLNMKYFNIPKIDYSTGKPIVELIYNDKFTDLFGSPRNQNEDFIDQIYKDYAASIQKVFENIVLTSLSKLKKKYGCKNLYLTGGCALNGLTVSKILESCMFEDVRVGPAPNDAGGAIGSVASFYIKKNKIFDSLDDNPFLGSGYSDKYVQNHLIDNIENKDNYKIRFYDDFNELAARAASIIKEKKIIFWFQDRMEFGPRALGNRSILANPSVKNIKDILNLKIKKREVFRPFAPAIMQEFAEDYFYMQGKESPFMNIIFKAKENTKNIFPGIVHVDGTSRVQTVSERTNKKFYKLINEFYKITNYPILVNTSLNINGPIAESPIDAFNYFLESEVESIVLNNWMIELKK